MVQVLNLFVVLLPVIALLLLGLIAGGTRERRHLADLREREERMRRSMIVTQNRTLLSPVAAKTPPQMLTAEVVIATDYLKSFFASWRKFFGGEIRSYQTLMDRARREAVMRVVEQAQSLGYNAVGNVRLQTADIGGANTAGRGPAMAAILASATAYHSGEAIAHEPQA